MRVYKSKGAWWVEIRYGPGGEPIKTIRRKCSSKTEATAKGARILTELSTGTYRKRGERVGPEGAMSVDEWAKHYLELCAAKYRPAELRNRQARVRYFCRQWGDRDIVSLGQQDLESLLARLREAGRAANTMRLYQSTYVDFLRQAWKAGRRPPADVDSARMPVSRNRVCYLTRDEFESLLTCGYGVAVQGRWRVVAYLGAHAGLRIGEMQGLQWSDVDFTNRVVHVRRSIDDPAGGPWTVQETKNCAHRAVPMSKALFGCLADWERHCEGRSIWVVDAFKDPSRPEHRWQLRVCWTLILKEAGLYERFPEGSRGFHLLRHTFASWLAQNGTQLETIRELMGHSNIAMVTRYAHLAPGAAADAVANL